MLHGQVLVRLFSRLQTAHLYPHMMERSGEVFCKTTNTIHEDS